jgi:class 3 adenylate cyclase
MTGAGGPHRLRYGEPPPDGRPPRALAPVPEVGDVRYPFHGRLEIGRDDEKRPEEAGLLLVPDPTVSKLHCVVTQRADGRCFVRDVSRNGTRLDGRRLVPNVETEWQPGQVLAVGGGHAFLLLGERDAVARDPGQSDSTIPAPSRALVTVLVGDIHDYTGLVRRGLSEDVQRAVSQVFERLDAAVLALGGTVKEYQGDAIVAFWEGDAGGRQVATACRAALALDALAARLAADPAAWPVPDFPLRLDWALSSGLVLIDSYGKNAPTGLAVMGEAIVKAFRMEKYADDATGRIVACSATRELAGEAFAFRDLGERLAKGFDRPDRVFALDGERGSAAPPA